MAIARTDVVKGANAALPAAEILRSPASVLLGVSAATQTALEGLGIRTVFDLAASGVFDTATKLVALETDPTRAEARLNAVAADVVVPPSGTPVSELSRQGLTILKDFDVTRAAAFTAATDVRTVRELAFWPPYRAAAGILQNEFGGSSVAVDPEAPPDLVPTSGVYPTERVFYRRLVIDVAPQPSTGITPIEQTDPIDVTAVLASQTAFDRLATGALLTFSQSWFSQGVTLGQLLHSMSLAPGESTRMAMIDWTRRTRASSSEDIEQAERLSNDQIKRHLEEPADA